MNSKNVRNFSLKFYSGKKPREFVILVFVVMLVFVGFLRASAQEEKILQAISEAREDVKKAKKTTEENMATIRKIESDLGELKNAITKLEYSDSTQKDKISEIENKLNKPASGVKDIGEKLKEIEKRLNERSYPGREEVKTSYIIGCTVDKTKSLDGIPGVVVTLFFEGGSVDSLSLESGPDGRFNTSLPIGVGDHFIYEAKKTGFKPLLNTVTISQSPLLLQIPLSEQYPTRTISIAIKTRDNCDCERKLANRILKLRWGGEIQRTYKTDKSGFIAGVEIPMGNVLIEYKVLHEDLDETEWEPMVSSKLSEEWKIFIEKPK